MLAQDDNTFYFLVMAVNIADLFEHAADSFPERVAVACGDREVTYRQLEDRTNRLAHYLAQRGVGQGTHVGVYVQNSIETVETLLAAYKLRAVAVNVNYRYVENELRYLFQDADIAALVLDRRYSDKVAAVLPDVPCLRNVVVVDDGSDADFERYGGVAYEDALAAASPDRDFGPRSPDDIYMLYTGGTTGYPKGVIWRHEDVWRVLGGGIDFLSGIPMEDEFAQSKRGLEIGGLTRLCLAPLMHGNAQWASLASLFSGDSVVLVPKFDPDEIWRVVERRKVNVVVLIGDAMARPLIETYQKGGYDASSVGFISSSAALFSPIVKRQYVETFPNVMITDAIGSSETGFMGIGLVSADDEPTDGGPRVMVGPQTTVIDEYGRVAAPGVIGRLARGGHVPIGYYKDPVKTAELLTEVDGVRYSMPGDFARIEDDGTITLLGRGNTCVNTGGEKVFPEEVEGALKSHPDVFDAIVIGVPDECLGQRVAAIVRRREGTSPDRAGLEAHVREQIAGYKVPRSIWIVDEITRTPSGKADYRWAKRFAEEHASEAV
jgi:acyl-CoA synthetase (AMP-forming)/AMP-acid ligase II